MGAETTPPPWVCGDESDPNQCGNIYSHDATGSIIASCVDFIYAPRDKSEQNANAAFIVKAVNCHDELVAALKACITTHCSNEKLFCSACSPARAALAKAEAGQESET